MFSKKKKKDRKMSTRVSHRWILSLLTPSFEDGGSESVGKGPRGEVLTGSMLQ